VVATIRRSLPYGFLGIPYYRPPFPTILASWIQPIDD